MTPSESEKVLSVASLIVKTNKLRVFNVVKIVILVEVFLSVWKTTIRVVFVFFRDILFSFLVIFRAVRVFTEFFICRIDVASSMGVSSKGSIFAKLSYF